MFKKILIANRGLIGLHCIRAVKELGAVAALVSAGREQFGICEHSADEVHLMQTDDSSRAFYDIDQLLSICEKSGADALHPGYGFLAESEVLSAELAKRNVKLISSVSSGGSLLCNKSRIIECATALGLSVIPRSKPCSNLDELKIEAKKIGYPVVLKPVYATGGRAIRIVPKENRLEVAYQQITERSKRRSLSISSEVVCEKLVTGARQFEVVLLRDERGKAIALPLVEGSVQRRHQKFVMESPPANLPEDLKTELKETALALADKATTVGVISFEFLLEDGRPSFLEANTSIQPNYLISSVVTGIDVLKEQIRLIAGEPLELDPAQAAAKSHAIFASVNAEDPEENFAPSPDTLRRFDLPSNPGFLACSAVTSGENLSSLYDPLIASLIAWGPDRESSTQKLLTGLDTMIIEGVKTNTSLLRAIVSSEDFLNCSIGIDYLKNPRTVRDLLREHVDLEQEDVAALVAALTLHNDTNKTLLLQTSEDNAPYSFWNFTSRLLNRNKAEL